MLTGQQAIYRQRGSTLLEALVAILIFSIGVLGLIGLQAVSIKNSIDAKYRADAAFLANQIIGQMWVDRANIDNYAHYITNVTPGTPCDYSGSASTQVPVTNWIAEIGKTLPAASLGATKIAQIQVTTPTPPDMANTRQVTVTVCWQSPQEIRPNSSPHNFVATAHINL